MWYLIEQRHLTFVSTTVIYNFHWTSWCPSLRNLRGIFKHQIHVVQRGEGGIRVSLRILLVIYTQPNIYTLLKSAPNELPPCLFILCCLGTQSCQTSYIEPKLAKKIGYDLFPYMKYNPSKLKKYTSKNG